MKILVIGQGSYDITAQMDEMIEENKKYRIEKTFCCPGGPAFNAACLLGMWGAEVYLAARLGNDFYGQEMRQFAKERNVNLQYLIEDSNRATPYSNIFIHNGARTIFNYVQPMNQVEYECGLEDVDIILADGQESELTLKVFEQYPDAIKVMDLGSYRKERMPIAQRVDYLITSKQFASSYINEEISKRNYDKAITMVEQINSKVAVITLGEDGLIYRENGKTVLKQAYKAQAVDSTGAGDIFHGAFVYGLSQNMSFHDCLDLASMAASISTERKGSSLSIPSLMTVKKRLENN